MSSEKKITEEVENNLNASSSSDDATGRFPSRFLSEEHVTGDPIAKEEKEMEENVTPHAKESDTCVREDRERKLRSDEVQEVHDSKIVTNESTSTSKENEEYEDVYDTMPRHQNQPKVQKANSEVGNASQSVENSDVNMSSVRGIPQESNQRQCRRRKPGRTVLECMICKYKTTHRGHMMMHVSNVHPKEKSLKCKYEGCRYECGRNSSMVIHEKRAHGKYEILTCAE